jgi:hypothetical protein
VIPYEVVSERDLKYLVELVKKLIRNETTLADEFPGYVYAIDDWFNDAHLVWQRALP